MLRDWLFLWIPKRCPYAKHGGPCRGSFPLKWDVKRRRMNTDYVEDERNFLTSCTECFDDTVEYYDELWQDYYASRF